MAAPVPPVPIYNFINVFPFPFDCIRKDDPQNDPTYKPNDFDNQRYEVGPSNVGVLGSLPIDSKLIEIQSVWPFRMLNIIGGPTVGARGGPGHTTLEQVFAESQKYWNLCPWGTVSNFVDGRDFGLVAPYGQFNLGDFILAPGRAAIFNPPLVGGFQGPWDGNGVQVIQNSGSPQLVALSQWLQIGSTLTPPLYLRSCQAFQVINPPTIGRHPATYDLWRVTGRWSWRSGTGLYDDDGYPTSATAFPNPPWANSSDFTQLISGATLEPGQIVTVAPFDFDPIAGGHCQTPPAPSNDSPGNGYGAGQYSDWDGWSVGVYIVITFPG